MSDDVERMAEAELALHYYSQRNDVESNSQDLWIGVSRGLLIAS